MPTDVKNIWMHVGCCCGSLVGFVFLTFAIPGCDIDRQGRSTCRVPTLPLCYDDGAGRSLMIASLTPSFMASGMGLFESERGGFVTFSGSMTCEADPPQAHVTAEIFPSEGGSESRETDIRFPLFLGRRIASISDGDRTVALPICP